MIYSGDFRCKRIKIPRVFQNPRRRRTAGASSCERSSEPEDEKSRRCFELREVIRPRGREGRPCRPSSCERSSDLEDEKGDHVDLRVARGHQTSRRR
jgi:hypothetical protein